MHDIDGISRLLDQLNLGKVIGLKRVYGGLLHHMFQVETSKKRYAVKVLNPMIMRRDTAFDNYIFSEKFARHACKHGIKGIAAHVINEQVVHRLSDGYCLIFDWVDGQSGGDVAIDLEMCSQIGSLLADIHNLEYEFAVRSEHSREPIQWNLYLSMADNQNSSWMERLKVNLNLIMKVEKKANRGMKRYSADVVSHRDLDPKNIMWDESGVPTVIDWEASGPINSIVELLEVALYWSGSHISEERFGAVIQAYSLKRELSRTQLKGALDCIFDGKLNWLEYNIKRSLGIESSDQDERDLGSRQVEDTIEEIVAFESKISLIYDYIDEIIERE